jgi:hypothetical protein
MIKPKIPVVGVSKVNARKRSVSRPKPTVSMLLEKYTSHKADNMFNRLGGHKRLTSPTRLGGHERWRRNTYNQQPHFHVTSAYWGRPPSTYPQHPPWSFSPWAPYPTRTKSCFQPGWIPSRTMLRPDMHDKRAHFDHDV